MLYALIIGGVLSAWALLRLLGNEREQQLRELEARFELEQADRTPASPPAAQQS